MRHWQRLCVALCGLALLGAPSVSYGQVPWQGVSLDITDYGHVRNISPGYCAAAATINSFAYLWNTYPEVYGSTQLFRDYDSTTPGIDQADFDLAMIELAEGWTYNGVSRDGIYARTDGCPPGASAAFWNTKLQWLSDWAPYTTMVGGQMAFTKNLHYDIGLQDQTVPQWNFLYGCLLGGCDIELGLYQQVGDAHAVTLSGMYFQDTVAANNWWDIGEPIRFEYIDPNQYAYSDTNDPDYAAIRAWEAPITADVTYNVNCFEFDWWQNDNTFTVGLAFAEAPVTSGPTPEPSAFVLLLSGIPMALWVRRRKR